MDICETPNTEYFMKYWRSHLEKLCESLRSAFKDKFSIDLQSESYNLKSSKKNDTKWDNESNESNSENNSNLKNLKIVDIDNLWIYVQNFEFKVSISDFIVKLAQWDISLSDDTSQVSIKINLEKLLKSACA